MSRHFPMSIVEAVYQGELSKLNSAPERSDAYRDGLHDQLVFSLAGNTPKWKTLEPGQPENDAYNAGRSRGMTLAMQVQDAFFLFEAVPALRRELVKS